ncbi:hypothetical protein PanWU01x14_306430 [Parasponia andersonii]|uniref:Uncharacterized protein n=1 Tax=Parasponia andersonii TaxID=3476 RepID=A0A2P5ART2_PARAD|nr:hypothetical protein PanWU01x14_306430 [Parasponia andersonii]
MHQKIKMTSSKNANRKLHRCLDRHEVSLSEVVVLLCVVVVVVSLQLISNLVFNVKMVTDSDELFPQNSDELAD